MQPSFPTVKIFRKTERAHVRAQQAWLVLVAGIMGSERDPTDPYIVSYGDVAEAMGLDRRAGISLRTPLGILGEYCVRNGLPAINSIVVNDRTGRPGDGVVLGAGRSIEEEQAEVMRGEWFSIRVPTTGALRRAWEIAKEDWPVH